LSESLRHANIRRLAAPAAGMVVPTRQCIYEKKKLPTRKKSCLPDKFFVDALPSGDLVGSMWDDGVCLETLVCPESGSRLEL
jgi:hypothetical protein